MLATSALVDDVTEVAVAALSAPRGSDVLARVSSQLAASMDVDCMIVCEMNWNGTSYVRGVSHDMLLSRLPLLMATSAELTSADPRIAWVARHQPTTVCVPGDHLPDSRWRRSPMAVALRPLLGRNQQLLLPVWLSPDRCYVWSASRDGAYRTRDRELAAAVLPIVDAITRHQAIAQHTVSASRPDGRAQSRAGLTGRELVVLRMLDAGDDATSVATQLGISVRTVHKHAERIYRKLGVVNRSQALAAAASIGLVEPLDPGRLTFS